MFGIFLFRAILRSFLNLDYFITLLWLIHFKNPFFKVISHLSLRIGNCVAKRRLNIPRRLCKCVSETKDPIFKDLLGTFVDFRFVLSQYD